MTENEKKLLRQQAEAYAFIHDLRRTALANGDGRYIRLTEGIEHRVVLRQQQYPTLFKRYFNEALKRADAERMKTVSRSNAPPAIDHVEIQKNARRKTKAQEKSKEKDGRLGGVGHATEGRAPARKRKKAKRPRKRSATTSVVKSDPE